MDRVVVILSALALDLTLGDPPNRFHPLMLMGRWLNWGRKSAPARRRFWFGAGWIVAGIALFSLPFLKLGARSEKLKAETPQAGRRWFLVGGPLLLPAFLLKPVLAYRNLRRAVAEIRQALVVDDLPEARRLLSWHLVSRDTDHLNQAEVAGATIESLAENITDSLVAPLLAYALGGLPAAWAYRFVNTADAMWGYRTPEFEQLGKFPARLDDVLNWLPARLTGWLLVAAAGLAGEDPAGSARTMLAQHSRTTSLNAGWTMSAMAGALGVTLNKRGVYDLVGGRLEPEASTIGRAQRVADITVWLGLIVLAAINLILWPVRITVNRG